MNPNQPHLYKQFNSQYISTAYTSGQLHNNPQFSHNTLNIPQTQYGNNTNFLN